MTVHTCVNCRNSVGLDDNRNYFTVSVGSHRGQYTVCYACWALDARWAARSVLEAARKREAGAWASQEAINQHEDDLAHAAGRDRRGPSSAAYEETPA